MKQKLYQTAEGRILFSGILLSLALLMVIGYFAVVDMETAKILVLTLIAHTFGGRAAGIGICIMHDFGSLVTIGYNFYLEVLIVCFTYSIFVLTVTNYVRIPWLQRAMEKISRNALEQKDKIEAYGWIGIFLFVMAPFFMTGPVVGSVIGYMIRIPLVKNLGATFGGTLTAIIVWFFCFDFMENRFHVIQYVFAGIIIVVILSKYKSIKNFLFGRKD
nr:small multi-drug export protein [Desulfobacula sp.]